MESLGRIVEGERERRSLARMEERARVKLEREALDSVPRMARDAWRLRLAEETRLLAEAREEQGTLTVRGEDQARQIRQLKADLGEEKRLHAVAREKLGSLTEEVEDQTRLIGQLKADLGEEKRLHVVAREKLGSLTTSVEEQTQRAERLQSSLDSTAAAANGYKAEAVAARLLRDDFEAQKRTLELLRVELEVASEALATRRSPPDLELISHHRRAAEAERDTLRDRVQCLETQLGRLTDELLDSKDSLLRERSSFNDRLAAALKECAGRYHHQIDHYVTHSERMLQNVVDDAQAQQGAILGLQQQLTESRLEASRIQVEAAASQRMLQLSNDLAGNRMAMMGHALSFVQESAQSQLQQLAAERDSLWVRAIQSEQAASQARMEGAAERQARLLFVQDSFVKEVSQRLAGIGRHSDAAYQACAAAWVATDLLERQASVLDPAIIGVALAVIEPLLVIIAESHYNRLCEQYPAFAPTFLALLDRIRALRGRACAYNGQSSTQLVELCWGAGTAASMLPSGPCPPLAITEGPAGFRPPQH
jgi:hypothetical protein